MLADILCAHFIFYLPKLMHTVNENKANLYTFVCVCLYRIRAQHHFSEICFLVLMQNFIVTSFFIPAIAAVSNSDIAVAASGKSLIK